MLPFSLLNTPGTIEFEDLRLPGIKTNVPRGIDIDFTETASVFNIYRKVDIEEIIQPQLLNLRYQIDLTTQVEGAIPVVNFGTLPSGVTLFASNNIYIVSGIDTLAKWNAVKDPEIQINDFLGNFSYTVKIIFFNGTADQEIRWTVGTYVPAALLESAFAINLEANKISTVNVNMTSQFNLTAIPNQDLFATFSLSAVVGLVKTSNAVLNAQTSITASAVKLIDFETLTTLTTPTNIILGGKIASTDQSQPSELLSGNPIVNFAALSGSSSGFVNTTTNFLGFNSDITAVNVAQAGPTGVFTSGTVYRTRFENTLIRQKSNPTGANFDQIAINPSRTKIAVSNANSIGLIYVFAQSSSQDLLFTIQGPTRQYKSLHMDDTYIVATTTNAINVYSTVDGSFIRTITPPQSILEVAYYRENEISISYFSADFTHVFNIETGSQIAEFAFRSRTVTHNSIYYAFRPASVNEVRIYDTATVNLLRTITPPTSSTGIAIEENFLLVGSPGSISTSSNIYLYT